MRARALILLLLLVPVAGCGDGDDVGQQDLIRAAEATRDAGGARLAMKGVVALGIGRAYGFSGTGVRDARGSTDITNRYWIVKGDPPPDPDTTAKVRSIKIGEQVYFTDPDGESNGKPWSSIEYGKRGPHPSSLYAGPDPMDPDSIARLVATGELRKAGRERVRGLFTTHYAATVELREFVRLVAPKDLGAARQAYVRATRLGGSATMRVELWVDEHDLIRRMRKRLSLRLPGDDYPPDNETTDFFDFGLDGRIEPPPQRDTEVLDPIQSE